MKDFRTLFGNLAQSTWDRINLSWEYEVSQGEETITDLLQLEIARLGAPDIQVIKTTKHRESKTGVDWEWWIGKNSFGWIRFVVQAKKVDQKGFYKSLTKKVRFGWKNQGYQHELLMRYASSNNAIPLYCFYNYIEPASINEKDHWHCKDSYEPSQLGCTLVSGQEIVDTINNRGTRTFNFIHQKTSAHPWRCLFCPKCSYFPSLLMLSGYSASRPYKLFDKLPESLQMAKNRNQILDLRDYIELTRFQDEKVRNEDDFLMPLPSRVVVFETDLNNLSDGNSIWI